MNVSLDFIGTFTEHRQFFTEFAKAWQAAGNKIGIIANERENMWPKYSKELGFVPDFVEFMKMTDEIPNVALWKVNKIIDHDVILHFDDDAHRLKIYTDRWIVKVMNSAEKGKF